MRINPKAYNILLKDESASLVLSKVNEKSSWQAGEILNKSHYKYLEIKQRAEKFFEMFTVHYNTYGKLVPDGIELPEYFSQYIHLAIEKRLPVKKLILEIDNPIYKKSKTREPAICRCILELKRNPSIHAQNLYTIIMDFDRFNNSRILPKDVQEPSAFKRRNKVRFKKHLKNSTTLNPYVLLRLKERFENNSKALKKQNEGFCALALFPHSNEIIRTNVSPDNVKELSRISIYIFKHKEQAQEYIDLVFDYLESDKTSPKKGLLFWPQYRNLVKLALNYDDVNNISPSRKGLYTALNDMDIIYKKRRNTQRLNQSLKGYE